ncbi:MAG TPA: hypothetical protein PKI89_11295, partial [Tepidiformaceae bacterium]|nr:hypothetical protein [Tepidiformaceae bacterium]
MLLLTIIAVCSIAAAAGCSGGGPKNAPEARPSDVAASTRSSWAGTDPAPAIPTGVTWFNVPKPLTLAELKGRMVLLDFWTLCCINCIHIMPDLAKLEKKYPNELVVIGVHSAKFESEKDTKNIKKAILR